MSNTKQKATTTTTKTEKTCAIEKNKFLLNLLDSKDVLDDEINSGIVHK